LAKVVVGRVCPHRDLQNVPCRNLYRSKLECLSLSVTSTLVDFLGQGDVPGIRLGSGNGSTEVVL
jgi:hypothetical protein